MELNMLINKGRLEKRIEELAKQIEKDYEGKEIVFVGILKGSVVFMSDLARKIKNNIQFEFLDISTHTEVEKNGITVVNDDIKDSIEGKNVIIVEDIIDTGRTLSFVKEHLQQKNPKSIEIVTLIVKPSRAVEEVGIKYIGYQVDDKFIVGYGLDYKENYRNLPYLGYIEK